MENFTPVSGAIGGILIGTSAALLWLGLGRIAGISGIIGNTAGHVRPGKSLNEVRTLNSCDRVQHPPKHINCFVVSSRCSYIALCEK